MTRRRHKIRRIVESKIKGLAKYDAPCSGNSANGTHSEMMPATLPKKSIDPNPRQNSCWKTAYCSVFNFLACYPRGPRIKCKVDARTADLCLNLQTETNALVICRQVGYIFVPTDCASRHLESFRRRIDFDRAGHRIFCGGGYAENLLAPEPIY